MSSKLEYACAASVASVGLTTGLLLSTTALCTATVKRNKELTPVQRLQWTTTFFEVGSNVLPPAIITSSALLGSVAYLVPRNAISSVLGLKQRYIYAYAAALMLANLPWTTLIMLPSNTEIKTLARKDAAVSEKEVQKRLSHFDRLHSARVAFGFGALAVALVGLF